MTEQMPTVTVETVTPLEKPSGKVLGFAKVRLGDHFIVRGIRIMTGRNGRFVSMPSREKSEKGETGKKGDKYEIQFQSITKEGGDVLRRAVMDAYDKKVAEDSA